MIPNRYQEINRTTCFFRALLYINETIPVAIRPRVRAKALPGEDADIALLWQLNGT